MCSYPELTKDHVLTSAYVKIFRTVTRNAVNKSVWRKKDCFWLPSNKHEVNTWLSSLRIRAHLSWRTSACSPCAPNLLHVLVSRIPGYHYLCSPVSRIPVGKVRGALGLCSNAEARHFSKLLTENHEKMWRQRDNMAIAVFHQQFARFMVGKFQVSKYADAPGYWCWDVKSVFMVLWRCQRRRRGRGQRHPREGEEGRPVWQLIRAQSSQTESFLVGCPFVLHCAHCSHVHTLSKTVTWFLFWIF